MHENLEYFKQPVDDVYARLEEFVFDKDTVLFTYIGDVRHFTWPDSVWFQWTRDHAQTTFRGFDRFFV